MSVLENMKAMAELAQKVGQIELYKQIGQAEDEVRELTREKRRLEDKVEELERAMRFREQLEFMPPFYARKQGDTTPYCARCFEKPIPHAVHVVFKFTEYDLTRWECPECKYVYDIRVGGRWQSQPITRQ
jgi:hypothetical protein